jgi:hypothetical protein
MNLGQRAAQSVSGARPLSLCLQVRSMWSSLNRSYTAESGCRTRQGIAIPWNQ